MAFHLGRNVTVKIDTSAQQVGGATATWTLIGQQIGSGHERSTDTVDTTIKQDNGWKSAVPTNNAWGISVDGALDYGDAVLAFLKTSWKNKTKVYVKIDRSAASGTSEEGRAIITSFNEKLSVDELYGYELELQGDGALSNAVV